MRNAIASITMTYRHESSKFHPHGKKIFHTFNETTNDELRANAGNAYVRVLLINQSHTRFPIRRAIFYAYPFLTPWNSRRITERCINDHPLPSTPLNHPWNGYENDCKTNFSFKKTLENTEYLTGHLIKIFSFSA